MVNTGKKPGPGTYECTKCGEKVTLEDDNQPLPACPGCGFPEFEEVN